LPLVNIICGTLANSRNKKLEVVAVGGVAAWLGGAIDFGFERFADVLIDRLSEGLRLDGTKAHIHVEFLPPFL